MESNSSVVNTSHMCGEADNMMRNYCSVDYLNVIIGNSGDYTSTINIRVFYDDFKKLRLSFDKLMKNVQLCLH